MFSTYAISTYRTGRFYIGGEEEFRHWDFDDPHLEIYVM